MDPIPAQPLPEDIPQVPISPIKKFLPFILGGALFLLLIFGSMLLFAPSSQTQKAVVSPTPRPTATPFPPPPTLPVATKAVSTNSAVLAPVKVGRLIFIKNGDIFNSDLASFSPFIKNATPAADKLSWSTKGNLLAWRPSSNTGTPSALTIYNRESKTSETIKPKDAELIDYSWSPDEKQIAVIYKDQSYHLDIVNKPSSASSQILPLLNRAGVIRQIFWPDNRLVIFSGDDGISSLDVGSPVPKLLVDNKEVLRMKLSADKTKILYSTGTDKKSDLYVINIDGTGAKMLPFVPQKVDMGTSGLPASILNNGFIPYALWFAKGDKLLVGYHNLTNLPLAGIYDLANESFSAIATFAFYENDFMIDDLRLAGARVNTATVPPTWQVTFFTLEDNAKLATIRVIPDASSPAFFGDDLLPEGNVF